MASTWAAQRCFAQGVSCQLLAWHRNFAISVGLVVLMFVVTSLMAGGWTRSQWPLLLTVATLVAIQIGLGVLSVHFALAQPALTVAHQLVAVLLVALLAALSSMSPREPSVPLAQLTTETPYEPCHG